MPFFQYAFKCKIWKRGFVPFIWVLGTNFYIICLFLRRLQRNMWEQSYGALQLAGEKLASVCSTLSVHFFVWFVFHLIWFHFHFIWFDCFIWFVFQMIAPLVELLCSFHEGMLGTNTVPVTQWLPCWTVTAFGALPVVWPLEEEVMIRAVAYFLKVTSVPTSQLSLFCTNIATHDKYIISFSPSISNPGKTPSKST